MQETSRRIGSISGDVCGCLPSPRRLQFVRSLFLDLIELLPHARRLLVGDNADGDANAAPATDEDSNNVGSFRRSASAAADIFFRRSSSISSKDD